MQSLRNRLQFKGLTGKQNQEQEPLLSEKLLTLVITKKDAKSLWIDWYTFS